jgi:hypothetical protein
MPSVEGVDGGKGYGVHGRSSSGHGVHGESYSNYGVIGTSHSYVGVVGLSVSGKAISGYSYESEGVNGESTKYVGVFGKSTEQVGVCGISHYGYGVYGESRLNSDGVIGRSSSGAGVRGISQTGFGVAALSTTSYGIYSSSHKSDGVYGVSDSAVGVHGLSDLGHGVYGESDWGHGVIGHSTHGYAAYLDGTVYIRGTLSNPDYTVYVDGSVAIRGPLSKPGGSFKKDHPLDPANKYLSHSFVESPDMKNIYDGMIVLDINGEAEIELPEWFGALNKDFRYQLTAIGSPGPNLYVAEEISDTVTDFSNNNNSNKKTHFKVAGGTPDMKVSWHVTGIRKDPWANAHRIQVEEDKPDKERGYYIYPELYNQPTNNGMSHLLAPEMEKELLINENKRPK